MNEDILKGKWNQFKGEVQKQWGKLTNDDVDMINGEYDKLVGRIQERYGRTREAVQEEVESYFERHPEY
ncbi:MAG: CsbD family protein [Ardenticatenaceae bacterium]|nr:CsbD family protein [Ardenticatenaceae bacterium]